jgi:hypothetical protein
MPAPKEWVDTAFKAELRGDCCCRRIGSGEDPLTVSSFSRRSLACGSNTRSGGPWAEDEVLLCQRDSSSPSGWITRSSFGDECPLHLAIARTTAKYMSDHGVHHYSQWFPGKENSVADALSRDFWLGDGDVVDFIKQKFAHQIPQGF